MINGDSVLGFEILDETLLRRLYFHLLLCSMIQFDMEVDVYLIFGLSSVNDR